MDVSFSKFFYFFARLDRIKKSVKPWSRRIRKFPLNIYRDLRRSELDVVLLHESLLPHPSMGGLLLLLVLPLLPHSPRKKYISSFFECDTSFFYGLEARQEKKWQKRINGRDSAGILNELFIESPPRLERRNIGQKFHFFRSPLWGREYSLTQGLEIGIKKRKNFLISSARVTTYPKLQKTSISKESHATENALHAILLKSFGNSKTSHQGNPHGSNLISIFGNERSYCLVYAFAENNRLFIRLPLQNEIVEISDFWSIQI